MDKVISRAIVKYGIKNQSIVAVEELSELQKEICKAQRGMLNKEHFIEEMADVWIMCEQLKLMYNITDADVQAVVNRKIERLRRNV